MDAALRRAQALERHDVRAVGMTDREHARANRLAVQHHRARTALRHPAAVFDFASGVNVLIGENSTGKSHVLKLVYCLNESVR